MFPDYRKSLPVLRQEWEACTQCNLGEVRKATGGAFVFGEGALGGIMFIGEGPGREENAAGRPFVGKSGQFLRAILQQINLQHFYITNTVCCRSFAYQYDSEGKQKFVTRKGVSIAVEQDEAPTPVQRAACFDRLHQEIYAVDPLLIVTLGGTAAETVLGRPVKILMESGDLRADASGEPGTVMRLPGALYRPVLTPKGLWRHKVRGAWVMNTEQDIVEYPVIPLLHPSFVLRCSADNGLGSPKERFAQGMTRVRNVYNAYMREVFGETLPDEAVTVDHINAAAYSDEEYE